jgi:nucleotide-binding universal stress UspA family protein
VPPETAGAADTIARVGLQGFERRLERLVEGTFNKAFRSGLQPVEIGHRVARVLDNGRTLGVSGRPVVPNNIGVYLAPADFERFRSFAEALARELAEAARTHAHDEGYQFVGPVIVTLVPDDTLKTGEFDVVAEMHEGDGGHVGSLVLPDGRRVALGEEPTTLGRTSDCTVTLADPRASRRHAEIRSTGDGFLVVDLGSMNGTLVNGVAVRERQLHDGDEISVGATVLRFEAS